MREKHNAIVLRQFTSLNVQRRSNHAHDEINHACAGRRRKQGIFSPWSCCSENRAHFPIPEEMGKQSYMLLFPNGCAQSSGNIHQQQRQSIYTNHHWMVGIGSRKWCGCTHTKQSSERVRIVGKTIISAANAAASLKHRETVVYRGRRTYQEKYESSLRIHHDPISSAWCVCSGLNPLVNAFYRVQVTQQ